MIDMQPETTLARPALIRLTNDAGASSPADSGQTKGAPLHGHPAERDV